MKKYRVSFLHKNRIESVICITTSYAQAGAMVLGRFNLFMDQIISIVLE